VSLLRPEIIRDLELAKHGLEILPLDGTFTPLHGDWLWRTDDHAQTMREIRRWSPTDADAYEEYGQLMADMARFIRPILGMVPPTSPVSTRATGSASWAWRASSPASRSVSRRLSSA